MRPFRAFLKWSATSNLNELFALDLYAIDIIEFTWKALYKNKDFLHENFVKNGATPRYIAKKIGCSRNTVKDALEKMDLLNKDTFKPQKSPSTCYGKKRIKGVLVDHLGELRIIKRMLELRNDGLSYRKIATHLNNNNVPTKKKYGSWDSTTVRMIINRTNSKDSN